MLGTQSRHATASRKHDTKAPHHESDSDRPRQTMSAAQRYNVEYGAGPAIPDRQHRSSRRPDASSNPVPSESLPSAHRYANAREQAYASGPSSYMPAQPPTQATSLLMATGGPSTSSRARTYEQDYDLHGYAKRRMDKQSPRSSEEKVYAADPARSSRAAQPRAAYPAAPQASSSSQHQSNRDPTSSSRHHGDRGRDREKDRERRREREREKLREDEERMRERAAALEKEQERQRRREEKELRRAEREREKERERRREEKELERARRHREKEKARELESRAAMQHPVYPQHTLLGSSRPNDPRGSNDQVPSSSSNIALPTTQHVTAAQPLSNTRLPASSDTRRDDFHVSLQTAPPHVPEKDRKSRRSRRDKALAQQYAQESGMSSSEQEQSGRERVTRPTDRRYVQRELNGDAHNSGPSGSENERGPGHERRKLNRAADSYTGYRQQSASAAQPNGYVPPVAQPSAPVGPASSQRFVPQVVSIRAGQGPADPETPLVRTKTPFGPGQGRSREPQASMPAQATVQTTAYGEEYRMFGTAPNSQEGYVAPANQPQVPATSSYPPFMNPPVSASYQGSFPATTYTSQLSFPSEGAAADYYGAARPAATQQNTPPLKQASGTPPTKAVEPTLHADDVQTPKHYARLSVYRSSGPAVSTELILPASQEPTQTQFVTVNSTTVKDLAAKFPLNEDFLTSASSSTLNGGTGRSAQAPGAAAQGGQQVVDLTDYQTRHGRAPIPMPEAWTNPGYALGAAQPTKQALHSENEVPIPIPGPRTAMTVPATPRLQPTVPPAYPPQSSARPQATPLQNKPTYLSSQPYVPASAATSAMPAAPKNISGAPGILNAASNSPAHSLQQPLKGSPSTLNAVPLVSGTPKQSPSNRIKARNGSSDTVVYPGAKASPSHSTKQISQRTSNGNLQAYAPSRPDTNVPRTATTEYPDTFRFRSQAPVQTSSQAPAPYPASNPPPVTQSFVPNSSAYGYQQPSYPHHGRSNSQPVTQTSPYDHITTTSRSQTLPAAANPPTPAQASSASAIAAAYRSGLYNTDSPPRSQQASDKRVPPRAAPSPAPSAIAPQYAPAPSLLAKSGFALPTNNTSQQSRAHAPIAPSARANTSAAVSHSRTQSDPQQGILSTRVAISGHPSTPAPTKAQLTSPSEQELLMTPSSLAPSMLKGGSQAPFPSARATASQTTRPPSIKDKDRDPRKKGGLFGLFRSRSSPPKPDARVVEALAPEGAAPQVKPRKRSTSQTTINAVAASVRNIITPHPNPAKTGRESAAPPPPPSSAQKGSANIPRSATVPPQPSTYSGDNRSIDTARQQIAAPTPVRAPPMQQTASGNNAKVFTPFRLISRRHRTVSAASYEAADGTATNTVIGGESARSSTAGRPSPPLRDPWAATQDWRNREEEALKDRGTGRRRRPGVVFDVVEEFTDTETHHAARKGSRR